MNFRSIILNLVLSHVVFVPSFYAASMQVDDDILAEVIAGIEANEALLQSGSATYSIETIDRDSGEDIKTVETIQVQFDYPLIRTEVDGIKRIFAPDSVVTFDARNLKLLGSMPPNSFSAIIRTPDRVEKIPIHPKVLGPQKTPSLAATIKRVQKNGNWSISTSKDRSIIVLEFESQKAAMRALYRVDPAKGYGVIEAKEWALKASETQPYLQMTASYTMLNNGAFLIDSRHTEKWIAVDGKLQNDSAEDVRLTDIKLLNIEPEAFRIEGLGLPSGARIQDRINNKVYLFGVPAVADSAIPKLKEGKTSSTRDYLIVINILFVLLLVGLLLWKYRRSDIKT